MEKRTSITDYLRPKGEQTQKGLADLVGLTQGAIFQMVRDGRNIFVIEHLDGRVELEEVKRITSEKTAA